MHGVHDESDEFTCCLLYRVSRAIAENGSLGLDVTRSCSNSAIQTGSGLE